ncbi:MAG: TIR domain-containing protein [Chloroflexi bacterium]|nr:MAG: TIR domain-containing protein [Chloroflexota bacterium]
MADVFISYSRRDKEFVEKIHQALTDNDFDVWVDWEDIPPGSENFEQDLWNGIDESNACIAVLSPEYLASEYCGAELNYAHQNNKRLIPIVYKTVGGDNVPSSVSHINWIFFDKEDLFDEGLQKLITAINTDLAYVREHTRLLVRAREWSNKERDSGYLLSGSELREAEKWLAVAMDKEPAPTSIQVEYIGASQAADRSRLTRILTAMVFGLIVLAVLAVFAANQRRIAVNNERIAVQESIRANEAERLAVSRQLATQSLLSLNNELDLSLLLSTTAANIADTVEARSTLLTGLTDNPRVTAFLQGHTDHVNALAFTPDGTLLATASCNTRIGQRCSRSEIRLWDVESAQQVEILVGHEDEINSLVFNDDGSLLISAGCGAREGGLCSRGEIIIWDMTTFEPVGAPLIGHRRTINDIALNGDGSVLASASDDETIILWDVATASPIGDPLVGHNESVEAVAFHPSGDVLVSGGCATIRARQCNSGEILVWDLRSDGEIVPINLGGHQQTVRALAFNRDGSLMASGSDDQFVILWDFSNLDELPGFGSPLIGHSAPITDIAFSPNSELLVTGSEDGIALLWDVATNQPIGEPLVGHNSAITGVAFHPDGETIATTSESADVILWNINRKQRLSTLLPVKAGQRVTTINSVRYHPDGTLIAAAGDDATIQFWDGETGDVLDKTFLGHENEITALSFSPDGTVLVSGSCGEQGRDRCNGGEIRVWDVATGEELHDPIAAHTNLVTSLMFSPDGALLASASADGDIMLWDAITGEQIGDPLINAHDSRITSLAFSPDGTRIASIDVDNEVFLWDVATHEAIDTLVPPGGRTRSFLPLETTLAFSPDGTLLASSNDTTITVWDVETRQPIGADFVGHESAVQSMVFSPDSQMLISGSVSNAVILWNVQTGQIIGQPLRAQERGGINSLDLSPDGRHLVSGGAVLDGVALVLWDFDLASWQEQACHIANRNLTVQEWRQLMPLNLDYTPTCPDLPLERVDNLTAEAAATGGD